MEKKRPTYDLEAIKTALGSVSTLSITTTALRDATALGYDRAAIVSTIGGVERSMFYKSMTTASGRMSTMFPAQGDDMVLYVKFQADVITEFRVMSFKEK